MRSGSELPFARVVDALCRLTAGDALADAELALALDALAVADAKHRLAFALNEAACLDLRDGKLERARSRATEALRLAELLDLPTERTIAHVRLARLADATADPASIETHMTALCSLLSANISAHARELAETPLGSRRARAAE